METRVDEEYGAKPGFSDEQFRVPKLPVDVELVLDGGEALAGSVHVAADAGSHAGRERVLDLLAGPDPFLPLTGAGGARLVLKERIAAVRVGDIVDTGLDESDPHDLTVRVEVRLAHIPRDRAIVRGRLRITMPPGRTRVLDYVNEVGQFFPLQTDDGFVLLARRYAIELRQEP